MRRRASTGASPGRAAKAAVADDRSARFTSLLAHRRLPAWLACLAFALTVPSLWAGLGIDDWWHRLVLLGLAPVGKGAFAQPGMFRFLDGDPARGQELMDMGVLPWWAWPELEAAFVRPLAEASHRLDYALWPDSPWLMHLQNALWFAVVAALAAVLYRRIMGATWVAGLAALLYVIDDSRGTLVGWVANRNSIMALAFGLAALATHLAWRRSGKRTWAVVAPSCLLLGLFSGEAALAATAYLFAYAVFLDRGSALRRFSSLAPYLVVTVLWWIVNRRLGYGVDGTALYIDPLSHPLQFAAAVIERAPIWVLSQWALPPASSHMFAPPAVATALQIGGAVVIGALALAIARLWREPVARFWSVGMALSLLPICATFPHERLLGFVGLGAMGLLAMFFRGLPPAELSATSEARRARPKLTRALRGALIAVHGVIAPLTFVPNTWQTALVSHVMVADAESLPSEPSIAAQDWVFVSSPVPFLQGYLGVIRAVQERPRPAHIRTLAPSTSTLTITRADTHTLVVRAHEGFLTAPLDTLYRDAAHPLRAGDVVQLTRCTVEVLTVTADERPLEVRFRFATPLEDGRLTWFVHRAGRFAPFSPPPVGESVTLAPEPLVTVDRLLAPGDS